MTIFSETVELEALHIHLLIHQDAISLCTNMASF